MTTTRQHIENLDVDKWARLAKRAAAESIEASTRLGLRPRPETVAVAAMTEGELVQHRERHGPAKKRPSPVMQLVEADQRSREAERRAHDAHQGRLDAEAAAAIARAEADESARIATDARERVRAVEAESAEKDQRRSRERAADLRAVQLASAETEQVRIEAANEIEQIRSDAAAEAAAWEQRAHAADERAEQRTAERTAERRAAERTLQELQSQLDTVRAEAEANVAAAREQARAADERAEQRMAERAVERAAGEEAVAQLRNECEQLRSDTAAEIAAVRGQASGEVAAARQAAEAEVAAARRAAQAEVESARAHAEDVMRQAQADVARMMATVPDPRILTIPIAPVEVRAEIRTIEDTLDSLYQIDYVLEIGMADVGSQPPPDAEFVRSLTWRVQEQAKTLSSELAELPARFTDQPRMEASASYARAAGVAYQAFLQRIEAATKLYRGHDSSSPDGAIIEAVSTMLANPWIQALR